MAQMERDPAQGVINLFGCVMGAIFFASAVCAGLAVWGLYCAYRAMVG